MFFITKLAIALESILSILMLDKRQESPEKFIIGNPSLIPTTYSVFSQADMNFRSLE